jgi:hypothetical protein
MTLIVEDGTNVPGANTYATVQQIRDYNIARGVTFPEDDSKVEIAATLAMDYLLTFSERWKGNRTYGVMQPLDWPRRGIIVGGAEVYRDYVPAGIVAAQSYVAGLSQTVDIAGVQDTRAVTKEVIGPLETDYSTTAGAGVGPMLPLLTAMLAPFVKSGGGLKARRV